VPLYEVTSSLKRLGTARVATYSFIHEWNEPYLSLASQSKSTCSVARLSLCDIM